MRGGELAELGAVDFILTDEGLFAYVEIMFPFNHKVLTARDACHFGARVWSNEKRGTGEWIRGLLRNTGCTGAGEVYGTKVNVFRIAGKVVGVRCSDEKKPKIWFNRFMKPLCLKATPAKQEIKS